VAAAPVANYVGYTVSGKTVYVSGQLPFKDGKLTCVGKLGAGVSLEEGYAAGRQCALNILAHLKVACGGDLDRVARVLKLSGFVNSTPEFVDAPKCVNGASDLLVAVFGDAGKHARAAVCVASLPAGAAVEVEAIVELK
jgi:enamine deaminase RidA (YjgF/YER057c/UK114 family)